MIHMSSFQIQSQPVMPDSFTLTDSDLGDVQTPLFIVALSTVIHVRVLLSRHQLIHFHIVLGIQLF